MRPKEYQLLKISCDLLSGKKDIQYHIGIQITQQKKLVEQIVESEVDDKKHIEEKKNKQKTNGPKETMCPRCTYPLNQTHKMLHVPFEKIRKVGENVEVLLPMEISNF
jgi:hypothetical protein